MAEIKIEKKKPIWPWILLALVILGIIAYVLSTRDTDDFNDDADDYMSNDIDTTAVDTSGNGAIYDPNGSMTDSTDTYRNDANKAMEELMMAMKDSSRFGTDSTHTKSALNNLAKLTVAKARLAKLESSTALNTLEQRVDMTAPTNATSETLSQHFKSVSDAVVNVIEELQKKQTPNKEDAVSKLKATASKLSPSLDLAKQQTNIQLFIRQAHDLLHSMNS